MKRITGARSIAGFGPAFSDHAPSESAFTQWNLHDRKMQDHAFADCSPEFSSFVFFGPQLSAPPFSLSP